ncbi:hypothetical protein AVW09_09765 [Microbacterium sp. T32]|nr:hypothetical protein AVW09_09765 [Microbacterium sp. T32]
MVRGPYKNGVERRKKIVAAAAELFGQYGYHGASLQAIADLVGTTKATLVSYFGSKEGLLIAVLDYWRRESSPETAVYHGLDFFRSHIALMHYHLTRRGLIELFLTMSVESSREDHPARPSILERQETTFRGMVTNLRHAVAAGEIPPMPEEQMERDARLLIAVMDGIELQWILDPRVDLEGLVCAHVDDAISRWSGTPIDEVRTETAEWLARHRIPPATGSTSATVTR